MNNKGYRVGFVIVLTLALVGLLASVILLIQLNTAKGDLATTTAELVLTKDQLTTTEGKLTVTQTRLAIAEGDLATTQAELKSTQTQLAQNASDIQNYKKELALYKDTWGSVVASDIQPPFQGADIVNQGSATNPSWAQLLDFVLNDKTDQKAYVPDVYTCGDYARDVHNNAERLGIRAAWVAIKFANVYHTCNAFKTTDRGLVFIDCTGLQATTPGPSNRDKTVSVRLGIDYIPMSLVPESGWSVAWNDMGTILDIQVYW